MGLRRDWRSAPPDRFAALSGSGPEARYRPTRVPVRLTGRMRAVISIPASHRDRASLLYDPAKMWSDQGGGLRISDGDRAVRFVSCGRRFTMHDGLVLVAGPQCVPFDIWLPNRSRPVRRTASFGAGSC